MPTSSRIVLLAAFVAAALVAVFPHYQDENGHTRGHSLLGSPPPPPKWMTEPDRFGPIIMPDGTVSKQPPSPPPLPAHIDWALVVRSEVFIAFAAWALMAIPRLRLPMSAKRIVTVAILGLVLPIPFPFMFPFAFPPLTMLPAEMYAATNHGIPTVVDLGFLYLAFGFWIYAAMSGWLAIRGRLER